jgi:hypothetical protein
MMEEITTSTPTSLTERVRAARERRGFTEGQLQYDPLLRSMIEHVARSEERAATEDDLAAGFTEVGTKHGLPRTSTASAARSRESWRGGGIRHTGGTGAAADGVAGIAAPRAEIGRVAAPYSGEV